MTEQWSLNTSVSYQTYSQLTLLSETFHTSYVHCFLQLVLLFSCNDVAKKPKKITVRFLQKGASQGLYVLMFYRALLRLREGEHRHLTSDTPSPDTCVCCRSLQRGRAAEAIPAEAEGGKPTDKTNTNRAAAAGGGLSRVRDLGGHSLTLAGHARACLSMLGGRLTRPPARLGAAQ